MLELPADLVFPRFWPLRVCEAGGPRGIGGGTEGVRAHVADGDSLTGSSGRGDRRGSFYLTRADAIDETTPNLRSSTQLSPSEPAGPGDQRPGAVIIWSLSLKDSQDALGAVGSPCSDKASVGFAKRLWRCHPRCSGGSRPSPRCHRSG